MPLVTVTFDGDDLSQLLTLWRLSTRPRMSMKDAAAAVSELLPVPVSWMMIQRIETGDHKQDPDPVLVAALALTYGHELSELPDSVKDGLTKVGTLVKCFHIAPALPVAA